MMKNLMNYTGEIKKIRDEKGIIGVVSINLSYETDEPPEYFMPLKRARILVGLPEISA